MSNLGHSLQRFSRCILQFFCFFFGGIFVNNLFTFLIPCLIFFWPCFLGVCHIVFSVIIFIDYIFFCLELTLVFWCWSLLFSFSNYLFKFVSESLYYIFLVLLIHIFLVSQKQKKQPFFKYHSSFVSKSLACIKSSGFYPNFDHSFLIPSLWRIYNSCELYFCYLL